MTKQKCKACKKLITGAVKIVTTRKKLGNKIITIIDYYDEKCFKLHNKQKATDEHNDKKRIS